MHQYEATVLYVNVVGDVSLMKPTKESNYNLARAYQQLGLNHKAVPLYRRVLDTCPSTDEVATWCQ